MRWREVGRNAKAGGEQREKPKLEAILDHYEVAYSPTRSMQMTRCPLHEDRTPSLSVDLSKQLWRCHSCGEAGDSYNMIMKKEAVNFRGALDIAAALGVPTGGAGGGGEQLSGSRYGGRRAVSAREGDRPRAGGYVPSWRR